ncbi:hypothetical protein [Escherichia phage vB_EcoM-LTH01]
MMKDQTFESLSFDDPRNHEKQKGYTCQCFVCGYRFLGPKRSVMCNLCINGKKPVDNS